MRPRVTPGYVDPRDNSESNDNFSFLSNAPLNNEQDFSCPAKKHTMQIFFSKPSTVTIISLFWLASFYGLICLVSSPLNASLYNCLSSTFSLLLIYWVHSLIWRHFSFAYYGQVPGLCPGDTPQALTMTVPAIKKKQLAFFKQGTWPSPSQSGHPISRLRWLVHRGHTFKDCPIRAHKGPGVKAPRTPAALPSLPLCTPSI